MTLDEAVVAVRQSLPDDQALRVDRLLAREDASSYLLMVLDARRQLGDGEDAPIENGPRLVSKATGSVTRLTVPDAMARAAAMTLVRDTAPRAR